MSQEPKDKGRSHRVEIVVAVIGLLGVLATALFTNWDKLFPGSAATPTVTPEISETTDLHYWSTQAFLLGHDLFDLMGMGMVTVLSETVSDRDEAAALYRGMRHAFVQEIENFGITIDLYIPSDVEWTNEAEGIDFFSDIDIELAWKIGAIDQIYYQPYLCGRWTAQAVVFVAYYQQREPQDIKNVIGALIETFDADIRGFQDFRIGDRIEREFEYLYNDLVSLSRIGAIGADDVDRVGNRVDRIADLIYAEAK